MNFSFDQHISFSLFFWLTHTLTISVTSWSHATLVKIAKMVILTHLACDQLVNNMVNLGGYKKNSSLVQTRSYLDYWLKFCGCFKILSVLGINSHKKICLNCKLAIAQNSNCFFSFPQKFICEYLKIHWKKCVKFQLDIVGCPPPFPACACRASGPSVRSVSSGGTSALTAGQDTLLTAESLLGMW